MATELIMPRLSDSMEEGTILKWLVAEGDRVEPGQALVEVETDKATVTHEADVAGVVLALTVGEGASVPVGAPIAVLGEPGEELPQRRRARGGAVGRGLGAWRAPGGGGAGARRRGPRTGPGPGRLRRSGPRRRPATAPASRPPHWPGAWPPARGSSSPRSRGPGPQGRVIRSDVERAMAGRRARRSRAPRSAGNGATALTDGDSSFEDLSRLQQTVARRMAQSRAEVPDIELRSQVDMSEAVALREQLRGLGDVLPSYNDFVIKAVGDRAARVPARQRRLPRRAL